MPVVLSFAQGLLDLAAAEAERRPELARKALRTAAGLPEHAVAAWRALAELHERQGQQAAAREAWREVLQRDPQHADAHAALARSLLAEGRWDDAAAHAGQANADACRAAALLNAGRLEEARTLLAAALALDPRHAAARALLALAGQVEDRPLTVPFAGRDRMADAAPPSALRGGRIGGEGASGGPGRNTPRPRPASAESPAKAALPKLGRGVRIAETLRNLDDARIAAFRDELGLLPKNGAAAARKDLAAALKDAGTLRKILRGMPAAARRLARSLVKLGGQAPAAAVFQTAGPEAPPPDYAQPLFDAGLLHLGVAAGTDETIAALPADLLEPLAAALSKANARS